MKLKQGIKITGKTACDRRKAHVEMSFLKNLKIKNWNRLQPVTRVEVLRWKDAL